MQSGPHTGIQAILYAMFREDETLDRAAMRKQAELSIGAGVSAVGALGLATEVSKLSERERRTMIDWVTEDVAGRKPTYFTIYGNSVAEQIDQVRHCERAGASYVILQPPAVGAFAGAEYIRYFGRVADATTLPVAIQNAPAYMGRGLTAGEIADLVAQHPNVRLLKGEGPVVDIERVIAATEGRLPVLNGRGGLELTDNWRAGCTGMILAPDTIDRTTAIWGMLEAGREADAERAYEAVLPTIVFIMQSVESLICYGKRVFAARAGLIVHDRGPALRPTELGLKLVARHAERLGMLEGA